MSITTELCSFVEGTDRQALPARAVERATLHILDTIGVTVAGATSDAGRIAADYVESLGGRGPATVVTRGRSAAQHAALVHGVMGHALDFDDYTVKSLLGHASVAVLPAALAVAEQVDASGADLLTAYVLGCEVACKLGACFNPSLFQRGWPATCVLGTFGATAAAGKLLRLERDGLEHAIGLAGSQASGLKANVGTMAKPYHAGRAAENGVVAATLASRGFEATRQILDVRDGFADVFGVDRGAFALGEPYDIVEPGFAVKRFPSCGATHAGIEAALALRARDELSPDRIRAVTCLVAPHTANVLVFDRPSSGLEAKFSMEYCIAVALSRGRPTIDDFTDDRVCEEPVTELVERVRVELDPELDRQGYMSNDAPVGATVTLTLDDGTEESMRVVGPSWDGGEAPPVEELVDKFTDCVRVTAPRAPVEALADALLGLDGLGQARTLTGLLP